VQQVDASLDPLFGFGVNTGGLLLGVIALIGFLVTRSDSGPLVIERPVEPRPVRADRPKRRRPTAGRDGSS